MLEARFLKHCFEHYQAQPWDGEWFLASSPGGGNPWYWCRYF